MRVFSISILILFSTAVTAGDYSLIPNFRTVHKGNLYRSAQISAKFMDKKIKKLGIKTVVNLRGEKPNKTWWNKEEQVVRENGAEYYNIKMSAGRLPHRDDLLKLLYIFDNAPRPILIHCHGGADRTGEASAIYKLDYMGKSKKEALRQLTLWYMHLKPRFPAKRYFIKDIYRGKQWAKEQYYPCLNDYKYYSKSSCK